MALSSAAQQVMSGNRAVCGERSVLAGLFFNFLPFKYRCAAFVTLVLTRGIRGRVFNIDFLRKKRFELHIFPCVMMKSKGLKENIAIERISTLLNI